MWKMQLASQARRKFSTFRFLWTISLVISALLIVDVAHKARNISYDGDQMVVLTKTLSYNIGRDMLYLTDTMEVFLASGLFQIIWCCIANDYSTPNLHSMTISLCVLPGLYCLHFLKYVEWVSVVDLDLPAHYDALIRCIWLVEFACIPTTFSFGSFILGRLGPSKHQKN